MPTPSWFFIKLAWIRNSLGEDEVGVSQENDLQSIREESKF